MRITNAITDFFMATYKPLSLSKQTAVNEIKCLTVKVMETSVTVNVMPVSNKNHSCSD